MWWGVGGGIGGFFCLNAPASSGLSVILSFVLRGSRTPRRVKHRKVRFTKSGKKSRDTVSLR